MIAALLKGLGALLLLGAAGLLAGIALLGHDGMLSLLFGTPERPRIDFATLERRDRPNQHLVCPPDVCAAAADRESPAYAVPATVLRDAWLAVVAAEPRVRLLAADAEALYYEFEQRSRFMRFPDTITVQFLPLGQDRSTLAVYSRAHYGYRDFGVNRARIERWVAALSPPAAP